MALPRLRSVASAFALALSLLSAHAQQPTLTADQIMARVAANQDRSEAARAHYVYVQHSRVLSRKGSAIRCEELTDTRITPTPTGSSQQLLTIQGRLLVKGNYITYNNLPDSKDAKDSTDTNNRDTSLKEIDDDENTDLDLVENIRANLLGDKPGHTKDGINANLFPLTSKQQANYTFILRGREPRNGRDTFHIEFHPKDKNDIAWKGDAWVDTATYEPVVIRTALSRNLPVGIRVLLGTNVPGIGFTAIYAPQPGDQPDGVWFPISLGSEFKIHVLYFFSRQIVVSAENRDFEKTHVTSTILDAESPINTKPQP
jgi:hypothetical protein